MHLSKFIAAVVVAASLTFLAADVHAQLFMAYNATSPTSFNTATFTDAAGTAVPTAVNLPASFEFNGAWNNTNQMITVRSRCYGNGTEPLMGTLISELGLAPGEIFSVGDPGIGVSCPPGQQIAITIQLPGGAETVVGT